ncbi:hypothetical protein CLAIMM_15084 [Cladophialophora immunda]|nr:hypothetical protein CLAIMM_15084 [Cladophialophora immunda]
MMANPSPPTFRAVSYIRKWIPELKDVRGKAIFDPYHRMDKQEFEKLGYPKPDGLVFKQKLETRWICPEGFLELTKVHLASGNTSKDTESLVYDALRRTLAIEKCSDDQSSRLAEVVHSSGSIILLLPGVKDEDVEKKLPVAFKRSIAEKGVHLYLINPANTALSAETPTSHDINDKHNARRYLEV